MNILITGITGWIGKTLATKLVEKGHKVYGISRTENLNGDIKIYTLSNMEPLEKDLIFENIEGIIHLAGASISKRWTKAYKKEIIESRTLILKTVLEKIEQKNKRLKFLISASGTNYYGTDNSDKIFKETDSAGKDYLAHVCTEWENTAQRFSGITDRIVILRTAVVLGFEGGALHKMAPIFKIGLGGNIGDGQQYMPWISFTDIVNLYIYAVENNHIYGVYNACTQEKITQSLFAKKLSKYYGKSKFFLPAPSFIFRLIFGEMSIIILKGSAVSNDKILETAYRFRHPNIESFFKDSLFLK